MNYRMYRKTPPEVRSDFRETETKAALRGLLTVFAERPQPRGAADSAGISMFGRKNVGACFLAENVVLRSRAKIPIEAFDFRQPATQHDNVWIEKIDHVRQRAS